MEQLKELTALVAAHGVYALSVIFIFYQQRRAAQNLAESHEAMDKRYFRKVHASVIVVTYALVTASTVIWFYATFRYQPVKIIKGEVIGLRKLPASGASVTVNEQLAPERSDMDFYPVDDVATLNGEYRFRWALLATEDVRQLAFRFVQRSEGPDTTVLNPVGALQAVASGHRRSIATKEKRFVLDLGTSYSPRQVIQLTYRYDDQDPLRIGTLWRNHTNGDQVPLKWTESITLPPDPKPAEPLQGRLLKQVFLTALAAPFNRELFRADGTYDQDLGRALAIQLASSDLRTRLFARQMLVDAGSRSFRFINDALENRFASLSLDNPTLLDSLSSAIDEMESRRTPFPSEGHLKLAISLYDARDYRSAAYRFEKAGNVNGGDPLNLARRAHANLEAGSLAKSIQAFNEYLAANVSKDERVWAYNGLAAAYEQTGRFDEVVIQSREALKISPDFAPALNGLAYGYAKLGKNLPEALALIERALKQMPGDPYYLETKGYVLFKLGRIAEAHELIRQAAAQLPNNAETLADLKEVEAALGRRQTAPSAPGGVRAERGPRH